MALPLRGASCASYTLLGPSSKPRIYVNRTLKSRPLVFSIVLKWQSKKKYQSNLTNHNRSKQRDGQLPAIAYDLLKAREESRVQGAIGLAFPHWLKHWHETFTPITKRSNRNRVITFDSHLKTTLTCFCLVKFLFLCRLGAPRASNHTIFQRKLANWLVSKVAQQMAKRKNSCLLMRSMRLWRVWWHCRSVRMTSFSFTTGQFAVNSSNSFEFIGQL